MPLCPFMHDTDDWDRSRQLATGLSYSISSFNMLFLHSLHWRDWMAVWEPVNFTDIQYYFLFCHISDIAEWILNLISLQSLFGRRLWKMRACSYFSSYFSIQFMTRDTSDFLRQNLWQQAVQSDRSLRANVRCNPVRSIEQKRWLAVPRVTEVAKFCWSLPRIITAM